MEVDKSPKLIFLVAPQRYLYVSAVFIIAAGAIVMFTVSGLLGVLVCNLWWFVFMHHQKPPKDIKSFVRKVDETGTYGTVCVHKTERLLSASSKTFELFDSLVR